MTIAESLSTVRKRIHDAALACMRNPADITLVAVSKTRPIADIEAALSAGQHHFGENYAQELRDKADAMPRPDIRWHFIGALQRNKVKYVVGRAGLVHDVDNPALAEEISKRSVQRPTSILLGVNIGREPQKSGWMPDQVLSVAPALAALPNLNVEGLMCIPPAVENPEDAAPFFEEMADLARRGRDAGLPFHHLSMGMSHDFPVAIRYGATLVRVGTAIFGARS